MKSILQLILTCFFYLISNAQNHSFDSLQNWRGALLDFDWKQNEISLSQSKNSSTLIYFEASWNEGVEFKCNIKLPFSPSSNNSFELLISDDSLFTSSNLISLKVGESGTSDGFDLFKGNVLQFYNKKRFWGSGGAGTLSIFCKKDSLVFFEKFEKDTVNFLGSLYLDTTLRYIGFNCKYTKSNANKFSFSDLFFGIRPKDDSPPYIYSTEITSKNEIEFFFNERIASNHLSFHPKPSSVILKDSSLIIHYPEAYDFSLKIIDSIQDIHGNTLIIDTLIFINYLNQYDLIITEIMANPDANINLLTSEYLELYNRSDSAICLKGSIVCIDGVNENLPDTVLEPNNYLVIYPKKVLKNNGSEVKILFNNETIHQINYNSEWYKDNYKKIGGWSLEMIDISIPCLRRKNWTATENINGGTPGFINSINGTLQNDIGFKLDHIFPINDTTLEVAFNYDIQQRKGVDSLPKGNLNVYELYSNNNYITLLTERMEVDSIYNLRFDQPIQSCWKDGVIDSTLLRFSLPSYPKESNLLINEILFNPDVLGSDYIEIFNNTDKFFNLKELQFGSLDENGNTVDVHLLSKENRLISPYETIAFTEDVDWLREQFFKNGNIVFTKLPACNNKKDHVLLISTQAKIIDSLSYFDTWHYSELNSTENIALERISPNRSNQAANWFSASSNSGYGTPGLPNSNIGKTIEEDKLVFIDQEVITPNNDGVNDFLKINFNLNKTGWIGSVKVINSLGITIHTIAPNFLFGPSEKISWNCELSEKSLLDAGIYVLFIKMFHSDTGEKINKKLTFYINRELN